MIVGNGLLARAFRSRYAEDKTVIVFASGVSNSLETRETEFARESELLQRALASGARTIYFGSCGVAGGEASFTPYMRHKQEMETRVLESGRGLSLRLPQVVGHANNPNTLTNFIRSRVGSGEHFMGWSNAERSLMDIDDIVPIAAALIDRGASGRAIAIAPASVVTMPQLVGMFEQILGKKANVTWVSRGEPMRIDAREALAVANELGIDLGPGYALNLLKKYYADRAQA